MAFVCPECHTSEALRITRSLELPPDSRSDEITLQIIRCSSCRFVGVAVYEESRRGRLDDESMSHTGYRISMEDLKTLQAAIKECPEPRNAHCDCETHRLLRQSDKSGRWNGLGQFDLSGQFVMQRNPSPTQHRSATRPVNPAAAPPSSPPKIEEQTSHFDRFVDRIKPPPALTALVIGSSVLAAALLYFPELVERFQLDSLAFGIAFCWVPIAFAGLLIYTLRIKDNAKRAMGWFGSAVLAGEGVMLVVNILALRSGGAVSRPLMFLLCTPPLIILMIPALVFFLKVWHETQ